MALDATGLLREGLLEGLALGVASAPQPRGESVASAVREAAGALGARVASIEPVTGEGPEADEAAAREAVGKALAELSSLRALLVDAGSLFAPAGREGLVSSLAAAWNLTRAAGELAFLTEQAGGRVVLLAPSAGGEQAGAAAAGLENLARTLSIEWARYGIGTVAVAPGADTTSAELGALVCYLLSPAGAYFSGCLMDLRGPRSGNPGSRAAGRQEAGRPR